MKRLILSIFLVLLFATSSFAADYYAGHIGPISDDDVWFTTSTGSCTGSTGVSAATALQAGNTLYANGCVGLTITASFTADKISTKAGAGTAGGTFLATANGLTATITVGLEGGTTTCLTVGSTTNVVNITILGNITSDATASANGLTIVGSAATVTIGSVGTPVTITGGGGNNSAIVDSKTVTTTTIYANLTGGTVSAAKGLAITGSSGTVAITGNANGGTSNSTYGVGLSNAATVTISGNCTGGGAATVINAFGCANTHATGTITVGGNCTGNASYPSAGCYGEAAGGIIVLGSRIDTAQATAGTGKIIWNPSSTAKFVQVLGDGTPTYFYMTKNPDGTPDPAITDVKKDVTYGWDGSAVYTGTLATGGGGAWAQ